MTSAKRMKWEEGRVAAGRTDQGGISVIGLEDFSRIVAGIYGAALDEDGWVDPLSDIRRTFGAVASGLLVADRGDRTIKSASLPAEAREDYAAHYRDIDYVLAAVERGPAGVVHDGRTLVALQPNSEFNTDWMKPYELDDGLFVRLTAAPTPTCFLVAAPQRSEPFASDERSAFVTALIPHWRQALRTHDHLRGLGHGPQIAELLDTVRHALIVLDSDCLIIHMNSAASRILAGNDGLRSRKGTVEATRPATNSELRQRIGQAVRCGDRGFRSGALMTCSRPSGKWPYIIHVVPLQREPAAEHAGSALLFVVDPDAKPWPATDLVRRIFGMTRAEAEVAVRVLDGDGLKTVSDQLNLSLATVKTHLQHVFDKTETHRQAELVRLLLAIIP